jgi:hypothetical protein
MAIEFAGLLLELADRIGPIVARHFREESIQENREIFQRNVIAYHDRVRRILYKDDGSPKRLAEDIGKDKIFCYYATDADSRIIIDALMHVDKSSKRSQEKRNILHALLRVFERARVPTRNVWGESED